MATNIALKRFKKAMRRKAVVAEKRRAEQLEGTLAAQIRRAAERPIRQCLLHETLFEDGLGTLILARGFAAGQVAFTAFLLDAFCLGIKDVTFRSVDAEEFDYYVENMGEAVPFKPVEPAYARKLLRDLAAWAGSIGFPPPKDFAVVEQLFGDVSADESEAVFHFGRDGKPCYMPGPSESPSLIRRRIEVLQKQFGAEGFDFVDYEDDF